MKINSLAYSEFEGTPREWGLREVKFGDVNLIVGKNAVGKTRFLNVLNSLSNVLSGHLGPMGTGRWKACFTNDGDIFDYELAFDDKKIICEKLVGKIGKRRKKTYLERDENGFGRIYAERSKRKIEFQSQDDQIILVSRQDKIQHNFFIPIVDWAKSTYHFMFGKGVDVRELAIFVDGAKDNFDPKDTSRVIDVFRRGKNEIGDKFVSEILSDMNKINYDIDVIELSEPYGLEVRGVIPGKLTSLNVKERDLKCVTDQHQMSAGMLRSLSLIVQFNYRVMAFKPSCFLIDDIGEGLDFERSCALIDILVGKSKKSSCQLFMSTNDRFVMNRVPIEFWTILSRNKSDVVGRNIYTDKDKFDEFSFTGMSNFDFFATDYLHF